MPEVIRPLRHRDFRLLWTGMSSSLLGDGVLLVALAWQVYTLAGVPAAMSAVGFAMSLPQVATLLVGGVVSDRFDRRLIMLVTDLVRGCCLTILAILVLTGALALWHIVVLVAFAGAASGFFGPAFDALVPELVDEADLVAANSLDQMIRPVAMQIGGPVVGGLLIATVGTGWAFALDAATFAASASCLIAMRSRPRHATSAVDGAAGDQRGAGMMWSELKAGIRYVGGNTWLWATLLAASLTYLLVIGPIEVLLPYVVKTELHGSAAHLGLVFASGGFGAILAALIVGQIGLPRRFMGYIYMTWALAALAVVSYGFVTASWQLAAACAVVNALEAAGAIAWATAKQRLVPAALLGRVSSVDWFISTALVPLSFALVAPVAAEIGVRATLIGAGLLGSVITISALYMPGVRRPERKVVAA